MGKRLLILVAVVSALAAVTARFALAQGGHPARAGSGGVIHVVLGPGAHIQFFDFEHDGLTLGDRVAVVEPLLNEAQTRRVGTAYADCWVGDRVLLEESRYVCTYVLKFKRGNITTQGLDPHGPSDVFFAITGGTGDFVGATGQAEFIDSASQTDIIISLEG